MTTYQHIVIDASVPLCLMRADMLDVLFRPPGQVCTTDCVLIELKDSRQWDLRDQYAREKRLMVKYFISDADEVCEMPSMQTRYKSSLTIAECSACMLAEELHCPLLTTDKKLRRIAESYVEVYGLELVIDRCVRCGVMNREEALGALERLQRCNPALLSAEEDMWMRQKDVERMKMGTL